MYAYFHNHVQPHVPAVKKAVVSFGKVFGRVVLAIWFALVALAIVYTLFFA